MGGRLPTVLVCEDEELYQLKLRHSLSRDFDLRFVQDGAGLLEAVKAFDPDAVVLDIALREPREGLAVMSKLRSQMPATPVIIHSGYADAASVVEAMRLGATDYVAKDCPPAELRRQLLHAIGRRQRQATARGCPGDGRGPFVGGSETTLQLRRTIEKIRPHPGNVIIRGESGAGKELVARLLRRLGRDGSPETWVDIDSSTIQDHMAESVLFGHERGSFTGAERQRIGLFEQAAGGTVYFDEISNMSLEVQAKLLRVLQEKRVRRMGSSKSMGLDFRVVAATNRDLAAMCREGRFRFDLYSRLEVFIIEVPPLRERRGDISALVEHFLTMYGGPIAPPIEPEAAALIASYDWPGNIRELANAVQFMLMESEGGAITRDHLPSKILNCRYLRRHASADGTSFRDQVKQFEENLLRQELSRAGNNVSEVARRLKMDRSSLYLKLDEHGLKQRASHKDSIHDSSSA
jgi:DNA-binding NtrC family response regulator